MNVTIVRMFEVINVIPYRTPLLGQGGVDAPLKKLFPSFEGAAGVVCSTTDNRWLGLNQPPRLRPLRRLRGILLMGAAFLDASPYRARASRPPLPRRGA